MKPKAQAVLFFAVFTLILGTTWHSSLADHGDQRGKGWYHKLLDRDDDDDNDDQKQQGRRSRKRKRDHNHDGSYFKPKSNPTYEAACGECHFLYQPELLPSASWMKILDQLDDHFGEEIELDPDSKKIISDYLKSNGAENSSAERAQKIMRSLGNQVPMRITDTPYIREKHHELNPEVFKRKSIGSLANCIACHPTAEQGIYEDDNVKIPE